MATPNHTPSEGEHMASTQEKEGSEHVDQAKLIKKLKHVVNVLKQQNDELRAQWEPNQDTEKVQVLESQLAVLRAEKDNFANIVYGLRGCVDQTSLVLERSKARFSRLHEQLSDTHHSLTTSQLEWDHQDEVMTLNELYQENEELRNTVSFIRSRLGDSHPPRSLSPSRQRPSTLDSWSESDMLVLENKDLREKLRLLEQKLRASQKVKRRYEQALERANSILDQRHSHPPIAPPPSSTEITMLHNAHMLKLREIEDERDHFKHECSRFAESERTALQECERVHNICHELQALLDTTTTALSERSREFDSTTTRMLELEEHLDQVLEDRNQLQIKLDAILSSEPQLAPTTASPPPVAQTEADTKRYAELVRRLETQFRNSQHQLESTSVEKQRLEGMYRAIQAECGELRNTLARYESASRDLRAQLSDREGRVQALESAKSLLSSAMFKTDQENKQLLWQLKSVQGADERLNRALEQLHQLQAQNIDQSGELKRLRTENSLMGAEIRDLTEHLRGLMTERAVVFSELDRINTTCGELHNLVFRA